MLPCHAIYLLFKTLGKSLFHASQWSVIQTFVHATMWHFTQPGTTGVSLWSSVLFVTIMCLPGILGAVFSPIISRCWLDRSRRRCHGKVTQVMLVILAFTCRICPSFSLLLSSAGPMEDKASTRTIIIALGVLSIALYVLMVAWKREDSRTRELEQRGEKEMACEHSDKSSFPYVRCFLKLECTSVKCHHTSGCSELLIGVFFVMGTRWCFHSINVFYENFVVAVVMFSAVSVYSFVISIEEAVLIRVNSKSSCNDITNMEGRSNSTARHEHNRSDIISVETIGTCPQETLSLRECDIQYDSKEVMEEINSNICSNNTEIDEKNDKSSSNLSRESSKNCITIPLCLLAAFLGVAVGSLSSLSIWVFTSPSILCRWGEVSTYPQGYAFFICFACGCIFACLSRIEEMYSIMIEQNHKVVHRFLCQFAVSCLLCGAIIAGTVLILFQKQSIFVVGGSILCFTFPIVTKIILEAVLRVVQRCKIEGKRTSGLLYAIPGIILFLGCVVFTAFHVLSIMFINPQLSSVVFGKIGRIIFPEVITSIAPLLVIPLFQKRIAHEESSCSKPASCYRAQDVTHKTARPATLPSEKHCLNVKYFQVIIIILFSLVVCLSKHSSHQAIIKCNEGDLEEISRCKKANESYHIRAMSWNILLGHKMNGRNNLDAISRVINHYNPHFLALQESDASPAYWGGKNVVEYLQYSIDSCTEVAKGVNPMLATLGVSMITRSTITNEWNELLPHKEKLPNYSVTRITTSLKSNCTASSYDKDADGAKEAPNEQLHVYSLHAVYKNWTCPRHSRLSSEQMQFVIDNISTLPKSDPVIVMGDFNINPSEPELGIWFRSSLGFQSALWSNWHEMPRSFHHNSSCSFSNNDDNKCDCNSLNSSSDPPRTTLINRRAAVDHIFYRGLKLVTSDIVYNVGNISDHYPIYADFVFEDAY